MKLPEGHSDLPDQDKKERLKVYLYEFDLEVKSRLEAMEKLRKQTTMAITRKSGEIIVNLSTEEKNMTVSQYREHTRQRECQSEKTASPRESVDPVQSLLCGLEIPSKPRQPLKQKQQFATPAIAKGQEPMWTATPSVTPMFDKRLLNITGTTKAKASVLVDGQEITMDKTELKAKLAAMMQALG